ncbi:MAG: S9 family peptidase, partial [Rhizobacter sp.]|nr:S9 family peptidase [Chlorobiales bacterium]
SSDQSGVFNLYTQPLSGGAAKQLTDSKTNALFAISFFPGDNRLLYASDNGGDELTHIFLRDLAGATKDLTPEPKAKVTFSGWAFDGKSFFFESNRRDPRFFDLYEMDIVNFAPKLVYQNDSGFFIGTISDDKQYISLTKTITRDNTLTYLYDRTAKQTKLLTPHTGNVATSPLDFSPDSKYLYIQTDEGREFGYINRYDLATGKAGKSDEADWDITNMYFSRTGKYRVVSVNSDARTEIKLYDAQNRPLDVPKFPDGTVLNVGFSRSEKWMRFYVNGSTSPSNLYLYNFETKAVTKLTNTLSADIDAKDLVAAEVVRYKSFDGMEIPAIFYKPHQASANTKVPAIVLVHGGPGGQATVTYKASVQYMVNQGYAVIDVNNRGSSGYGKTFYQADDLRHGEEDLSDCIAAKTFLTSTGAVDMSKVAIMGGSYGGYMTLAALAYRPDEFTAGVDLFGVANWIRTLKSIPPWWTAQKDALYKEMGNPEKDEAYLKKISPLFHTDKIKKPLIVLQGKNDPRVLKVESDEIVASLKKNNVPVEYVVFEDEGHGFVKKENQITAYKSVVTFLDKYLKGQKATP